MRNTLITVATTVVMIVILYANISKADENIVSSLRFAYDEMYHHYSEVAKADSLDAFMKEGY